MEGKCKEKPKNSVDGTKNTVDGTEKTNKKFHIGN